MTACKKLGPDWHYFALLLSSQDEKQDSELLIDEMTWRQVIINALKRSHGIFGEGIEFDFLSVQGNRAFVKVGYEDRAQFSSALSTYISSEELIGVPLVVHILQECTKLERMKVGEDDELWFKRSLEEEVADSSCN